MLKIFFKSSTLENMDSFLLKFWAIGLFLVVNKATVGRVFNQPVNLRKGIIEAMKFLAYLEEPLQRTHNYEIVITLLLR